ncbi:hypothetical protein [Coxiella endosymbiont of Ornithodoros maritimus]|uniref:hypothetical protein n=1 Tax=Coxiella endosymbiont of Ornithodoros maritimus TaxID=1656172 RepID=UPI0022650281|nr:hypothetical protein [Coxiella endosymbiont of Ornithodoros maritimus]
MPRSSSDDSNYSFNTTDTENSSKEDIEELIIQLYHALDEDDLPKFQTTYEAIDTPPSEVTLHVDLTNLFSSAIDKTALSIADFLIKDAVKTAISEDLRSYLITTITLESYEYIVELSANNG